MATRTNFYEGQIVPRFARELLDFTLFWPTDEEFLLIEETVFGHAFESLLDERFGLFEADRVRDRLTPLDYYRFLVSHLQQEAHGYRESLSEAMVLSCLEKFAAVEIAPALECEAVLV